jgi:TRAP-type C4-dicarboxylate transport system permease small subunit
LLSAEISVRLYFYLAFLLFSAQCAWQSWKQFARLAEVRFKFSFITQQPCMIVSSDASGLINTNYMYLLFIFVVGIIFFVFLDAVRAYVVQPCDMQIFMQKYDNFRKTNDV